jgi:hypothetical protein
VLEVGHGVTPWDWLTVNPWQRLLQALVPGCDCHTLALGAQRFK